MHIILYTFSSSQIIQNRKPTRNVHRLKDALTHYFRLFFHSFQIEKKNWTKNLQNLGQNANVCVVKNWILDGWLGYSLFRWIEFPFRCPLIRWYFRCRCARPHAYHYHCVLIALDRCSPTKRKFVNEIVGTRECEKCNRWITCTYCQLC